MPARGGAERRGHGAAGALMALGGAAYGKWTEWQ